MPPPATRTAPGASRLLETLFTGLFGAFLGVSLLKFGNPPIMEKWVALPGSFAEFLIITPWPITWAYLFLGLVALLGVAIICRELLAARESGQPHQDQTPPPRSAGSGQKGRRAPLWLLLLPLAWLLWQFLATTSAVDPQLACPTLHHFAACVVCFYLGFFSLSRANRLTLFWLALLCGFVGVLAIGWEQHFGGLAETRQYFFREVYPQLKEIPPEFLKRISSDRIFSTLFYPNALAGVMLLLLPIFLATLCHARQALTRPARGFLASILAIASLACLYWSGSKGGWLLALLLGLLALLRLPFKRSLKVALVTLVVVAGLAGFFYKYSQFFRKGATSVVARFDYWQAAFRTANAHPLFGTGPGTFAKPYQLIKRPESEMTRLVHNDYLEQASDSGWPGFLLYTVFITAALALTARQALSSQEPRNTRNTQKKEQSAAALPGQSAELLDTVPAPALQPPGQKPPLSCCSCISWFTLWLGVLGWSLQSLTEFGLYLPALAWPAFTFLGLLLGRQMTRADNQAPNSPAGP